MVILNLLGAPGSHLGGPCGSWEAPGSHLRPLGATWEATGRPWEALPGACGSHVGAPQEPLGATWSLWEPPGSHSGASWEPQRAPGGAREPPGGLGEVWTQYVQGPGLPKAPGSLSRLYIYRALGASLLGPGSPGARGCRGLAPCRGWGGALKQNFWARQGLQMLPPIGFRDFWRPREPVPRRVKAEPSTPGKNPAILLYINRALGASLLGPGSLGARGCRRLAPCQGWGGAPKQNFWARQGLQMLPPIGFRDFWRPREPVPRRVKAEPSTLGKNPAILLYIN